MLLHGEQPAALQLHCDLKLLEGPDDGGFVTWELHRPESAW